MARSALLARTALLVALVASTATRVAAEQPTAAYAAEQLGSHPAAAAAATSAAHTTACVLAGGWCPLNVYQQSDATHQLTQAPSSSGSDGAQHSPTNQHKPLLPLSSRDILGITLSGLALLVAASGGIGGGAILVPLYLMVLGFSTSGAVALSNLTIVGGTLANLAFNIGRMHPLRPGCPLIDWDLIMVMEPSTILGALLGGYLNKVLPGWLTTVCLTVLLAYITYKLVRKALTIRRKERQALRRPLERLSAVDSHGGDFFETLSSPLLGHSSGSRDVLPPMPSPAGPLALRPDSASSSGGALSEGGECGEGSTGGSCPPNGGSAGGGGALAAAAAFRSETPTAAKGERHGLLAAAAFGSPATPPHNAKQEAAAAAAAEAGWSSDSSGEKEVKSASWQPHLPLAKVAVLMALLAGVVGSDILKHMAACPSFAYWARATAMVPITLATLLAVRAHLLRKGQALRVAGHQLVEGDVHWSPTTTLVYPSICSLAGVCAGVFGVGGGIIKGPLMLEMGVLPEVAAATSATMIFFTSVSASIVFISFGAVQWDYGLLLLLLGAAATAAGQLLVMWVNRHLQSRSLLVVVMAAVLGVSAVALAVQAVGATVLAVHNHDLWHFHSICGSQS